MGGGLSTANGWLPPLLEFSGDWSDYVDEVYARFVADLVTSSLHFRGRRVAVRRHPETDGKRYGFWHCISEGLKEHQRVPSLERCERICWIRAVIENCHRPMVDHWTNKRKREVNHLLWYREHYLVVLSERGKAPHGGPDAYLLKTAYVTDREHTCRKLRRERDRS